MIDVNNINTFKNKVDKLSVNEEVNFIGDPECVYLLSTDQQCCHSTSSAAIHFNRNKQS